MADDGRVKDFDFVFPGGGNVTAGVALSGWRMGSIGRPASLATCAFAFDFSRDGGVTWRPVWDDGDGGAPNEVRVWIVDTPTNAEQRIGDGLLACYDYLRLRSVDRNSSVTATGAAINQSACTVTVRCWRADLG